MAARSSLENGRLVGEIVIKAVLDHRTDGHLRLREELLHRIREQVRGGVADDLEAVGILVGDDADRGVVIDDRRGVDQAAVHLAGQRRLGEPRADAGRDLGHRDGVVERFLTAVGKCNYGHRTLVVSAVKSRYRRPSIERPAPHFEEVVRASGIEPLTPTMSR